MCGCSWGVENRCLQILHPTHSTPSLASLWHPNLALCLSLVPSMVPRGFDAAMARLLAAGFDLGPAPTNAMLGEKHGVISQDDADHIQTTMTPYIDKGKEFIIIVHSYRGTPGACPVKHQAVKERAAARKEGGIRAIIFISCILIPKKGVASTETGYFGHLATALDSRADGRKGASQPDD
ncbi:uncharacterized protein BCR38DRAFT_72440 [Pseudomassariella vexata]|uniref:AB hydrolase-1 domain-containing protein n=1 Tax=Pseudomassariella vexata TaxID=1141098 RepID=A0A1Y2DH14_9PEZI|nr:uncharacterized protein BCR38DRAFT_72440 [Pseudomassariella vexata]ORY58384.1 hypothetical protein BCR38DRAFT_72440 [Pseudomassariella vexata]